MIKRAMKLAVATAMTATGINAYAGAAAEWPDELLDWSSLNAQALTEIQNPVRPGIPGKASFWNERAISFIYAPAFNFPEVKGAASYRFTARAGGPVIATLKAGTPSFPLSEVWSKMPAGYYIVELTGLDANGKRISGKIDQQLLQRKSAENTAPVIHGKTMTSVKQYQCDIRPIVKELTFEADKPWAALTPIWKDVPISDNNFVWGQEVEYVNKISLTVDGLERKGGTAIGQAGVRWLVRELSLNGSVSKKTMTYAEAARKSLEWSLNSPFIAQFNEKKANYDLGRYPAKLTGEGAIGTATVYARLIPRPANADQAVDIGRNAARALIAASTPKDAALPYLPPIYRHGISGDPDPDRIMMYECAVVGWFYLDLYDLTRDAEFLQAAVRIGETYKKTQSPDGSWPSVMSASSGKVLSALPVVLTTYTEIHIPGFIERLVRDYGHKEFQTMLNACVRYLREEQINKFHPQGLFEDTGTNTTNLSGNTAAGMAVYLFTHSKGPEDVAVAEDLMRFAEDQFVLWHRYELPCALEQYAFRMPICCSASFYIDGCMSAYKATGRKLWLAKAVMMAGAQVEMVRRSGRIPTVCTGADADTRWPNCPLLSANLLNKFAASCRAESLKTE